MQKVPFVVLAVAGTLITPSLAGAQTPASSASGQNNKASAPAASAAPSASSAAAKPELAPAPEAAKADDAAADASGSAPVEGAEAAADDTAPAAAPNAQAKAGDSPAQPSPSADAASLADMASSGPRAPKKDFDPLLPLGPSRVPGGIFAEDWWAHSRPIVEFHGYFRTRGEFLYNFGLGRIENPSAAIWARPSTQRYGVAQGDPIGPQLCTRTDTDAQDPRSGTDLRSCDSKIQNSANLRLRINPEVHISDNLRVKTQVDFLDNLVLGSTPEGYRFSNGASGTETVTRANPDELAFDSGTQVAPVAGRNSLMNSIAVKRAWAEYTTPIGEVRFGRMPFHWGMGMLYNSGDRHDDDYQTTVDRIQATVGIKPLELFITGSWDFANEGPIRYSSLAGVPGYDAGRLDDVSQYTLAIVRQKSPELERMSLSRGDIVINAGIHGMYRHQLLALDATQVSPTTNEVEKVNSLPNQYVRRDAYTITPDLWFQLKYQKFRFEIEAAAVLGSIGSLNTTAGNFSDFTGAGRPYTVAQFGAVLEMEQKLIEDRLRIRFNAGYASGDADSYDPNSISTLIPGSRQTQVNNRTLSMFRFNPGYRTDMILARNMFQRIQGMYFVRPGIEYDFIRDQEGQRAGGAAQAIWTRASEFVQTPGHDADLGIELNATVYYQAKDGSLNDNPDKMGGFYAALQYGVLFPLAGLTYTSNERSLLGEAGIRPDISAAQMLRLYLGVIY